MSPSRRISFANLLLENNQFSEKEITILYNASEISSKIIARFKSLIPGYEHLSKAYSQNGEDLILLRELEKHPIGRYIDLGAHDPFRFSNTALLHLNGWHGINIDPNPEAIRRFEASRPQDLNLQLALGSDEGKYKYYIFEETALNTISESRFEELKSLGFQIRNTEIIAVQKASQFLISHFTQDTYLFNIDIEGSDFSIIDTLDFKTFSPCFVLLEMQNMDLTVFIQIQTNHNFLKHYKIIGKAVNTYILRKNECEKLHA